MTAWRRTGGSWFPNGLNVHFYVRSYLMPSVTRQKTGCSAFFLQQRSPFGNMLASISGISRTTSSAHGRDLEVVLILPTRSLHFFCSKIFRSFRKQSLTTWKDCQHSLGRGQLLKPCYGSSIRSPWRIFHHMQGGCSSQKSFSFHVCGR